MALKVSVTGAHGLLGRAVVTELVAGGFQVRGVDRNFAPDGAALAQGFEPLIADLRSCDAASEAVAGCDAVVHLAAWPTPLAAPAREVWGDNTIMTANVAFAAAEQGIRRFIFASSQSVLGLAWSRIVTAPDYLPVDELHPCRPADPYSASKLAGEALVEALARGGRLDVRALRFPVIWEHDRFQACIANRLSAPEQGAKSQWAYIDARDAARAVRLAIEQDEPGYEVINVTSAIAFANEPVPDLVRHWYPCLADLRHELGDSDSPFDWRKTEKILGFRARYVWTPAGITDRQQP